MHTRAHTNHPEHAASFHFRNAAWCHQYSYKHTYLIRQSITAAQIRGRKHPDHLADSCKRLSINQIATGLRLSWCIMDFFSCLQLFKYTLIF